MTPPTRDRALSWMPYPVDEDLIMQNTYAVFRPNGEREERRENVVGTLFFRNDRWELETPDAVLPGTLRGHPHEAHVFIDETGLEYRIV